jgi:hypothetical protein
LLRDPEAALRPAEAVVRGRVLARGLLGGPTRRGVVRGPLPRCLLGRASSRLLLRPTPGFLDLRLLGSRRRLKAPCEGRGLLRRALVGLDLGRDVLLGVE